MCTPWPWRPLNLFIPGLGGLPHDRPCVHMIHSKPLTKIVQLFVSGQSGQRWSLVFLAVFSEDVFACLPSSDSFCSIATVVDAFGIRSHLSQVGLHLNVVHIG